MESTMVPRSALSSGLQRGLSARQVQMIAIGGTIGTGLFLGTGRSLAQGGPASMLICYSLLGFVVYVALLLLGEMATQYPVAGSFTAYAARFVSPGYAFALGWNYWLNDAVSLAGDLLAAQLVVQYWIPAGSTLAAWTWTLSAFLWAALVGVNAINVRAYGELEYWLSSLKVVTIVAFVLVGIAVNAGFNTTHEAIGFANWRIPGAPFVGGIGGFARVFVTASFAYGGTESLGITAGETKNPSRNMPRVVKAVFWRILIFYVLSVGLVGLDVPYNYPGLSTGTAQTSPFTLVFARAGSAGAASVVNAVVLSSVLSAGNHALFAGTRVLHALAQPIPGTGVRQAPAFLSRTTEAGVPLPALLATASGSVLCFASAFVGSGVVWGWLQNVVGVSNQIAWLSIGLASWRFRAAWAAQGRPLSEMKFRAAWTWGWGPPFVVCAVSLLILFQGWSAFVPAFHPLEAFSLYAELPLLVAMWTAWSWLRPAVPFVPASQAAAAAEAEVNVGVADERTPLVGVVGARNSSHHGWAQFVDLQTVDLRADEWEEDEPVFETRKSWRGYAQRLWEWVA